MLISFAVTAKLICVFVFAYAKSRFSHDAAHSVMGFYIFWQQSNNTSEVIPQEFADIWDSFAKGNSVDPDHTVPRGTV